MLLKKTSLLLFIAALLFTTRSNAQYYLNPFSQYGLGEFNPLAQVNQMGMGGTAYTQTDGNRFNFANPASYSNIQYFSFELGANALYYNQKSQDIVFKNIDAHIPYIGMAFPILWKKRWGFSMGLMPYSSVNYELKTETLQDFKNGNTPVKEILYQNGSGGLTRFYAGSSIQVFPDFFLGANAAYLFGNMQNTQTQIFPDTSSLYSIHQTTNNIVGGFLVDAGFTYDIHFNLPSHHDKQLEDSLQDLKIAEIRMIHAIKKPESPQEKLQRDFLKLDLSYSKAKDSITTKGFPKLDEIKYVANLKSIYKKKKSALKNSIIQDSVNAYKSRIEDYKTKIFAVKSSFKQKNEMLKGRRKTEYKQELLQCQTKTKLYKDSIKRYNTSEIRSESAKKIRKYKSILRDLKHKEAILKKALRINDESNYNPELNDYKTKTDSYNDSVLIAKQPAAKYQYLKQNSKIICSNYIQDHKYTLQLGGTANLPSYVPDRKTIDAYSFSNRLSISDSITHFSYPNTSIYMPLGLGGSIELINDNNLKITATAEYRQYSKLIDVGLLNYTKDYYSYGLGLQWTPPRKQFGNNAFTTGNYKIGFRYSQMPYLINNAGVSDMRFTLGFGLPQPTVLKFANPDAENVPKNWSYLDFAIVLGQTGNFSTNLLQQKYIMLSVGLHIFEVNWWMKRKLD